MQSGADSLGLPVEEYALLVPLETSKSAMVVYDSGNLKNSDKLPYETFPSRGMILSDKTVGASQYEITQVGLHDVFEPDPATSLVSIRLEYEDKIAGTLLFKASSSEAIEEVQLVCNGIGSVIRDILINARTAVEAYEWEIMRNVYRCPEPCLVIDQPGRIVSANAMFCELLGAEYDELVGNPLQEFVNLQDDIESNVASFPAHEEMITPIFIKTKSLFFMSNIAFLRLPTVCADRFMFIFRDLLTDQRTGNSNIQLAQKLSSLIMNPEPPQTILRKLVNVLTLTLDADLVCVLRRKDNDELIITPYSNRKLDTLRLGFIEPDREPVLEPYFTRRIPVFCEDVENSCSDQSFFKRILSISRFAFLPVEQGPASAHALLIAWSGASKGIGTKALPLFRIIANLMGTVLAQTRLLSKIEQERKTLRRYAKLTAGREIRMARLKRENVQLKGLIKKLSGPTGSGILGAQPACSVETPPAAGEPAQGGADKPPAGCPGEE
jgi:hypothetical protein